MPPVALYGLLPPGAWLIRKTSPQPFFNGNIVESIRLTISGLSASELYDLHFFASRTGAGGDNRQTEYQIIGGNQTTSLLLNASENNGNVASLTGITADLNNQIVVNIDAGPLNNNASRFFYLNVMELVSTPVPEPSMLGLAAVALGSLLSVQYRRRSRSGGVA